MATVQGLTKERMLAIEAQCIIDGAVLLDGHLELTKFDGGTIDAGKVRGTRWGVTPVNIDDDSTNIPVDFGDGMDPSVGDLVISQHSVSLGEVYSITNVISSTHADIVDVGLNLRGVAGAPGSGLSAYGVGALYISINSTEPSAVLGGGTWEPYAQGRFLVSVDPNDDDFTVVELTGGEKEHVLTEAEMPIHNHDITHDHLNQMRTTLGTNTNSFAGGGGSLNANHPASTGIQTVTVSGNKGGGLAHNNLPPFIAVYMWVRIA